MFQWDKSISKLEVTAGDVIHLFRSVSDVQLALPGLPAQPATAYLCQYRAAGRVMTVAVLHLVSIDRLAFYRDTLGGVTPDQSPAMLDQALNFIESMGFLMTDLDYQLHADLEREALWAVLPLQQGVRGEPGGSPRPATVAAATPQLTTGRLAGRAVVPAPLAKPAAVKAPHLAVAERPALPGFGCESAPTGLEPFGINTAKAAARYGDDLRVAVEAPPAGLGKPRANQPPPDPDELRRRRRELGKLLGRILASL
jgi:hypothetical protein